MEAVLERLQSAEAEDLPAVTRFLLQHAPPGGCLNNVSKSRRVAAGACLLLLLAQDSVRQAGTVQQRRPAVGGLLLFLCPQVVTSLRESLHFVCASDPRIAVRTGPGAVDGRTPAAASGLHGLQSFSFLVTAVRHAAR